MISNYDLSCNAEFHFDLEHEPPIAGIDGSSGWCLYFGDDAIAIYEFVTRYVNLEGYDPEIWVENVRLHGHEFRLIAHDKVASGRQSICGGKDKDDPHDAVCIGWLAWGNLESPEFFNRVKLPHQQEMLDILLDTERLNKTINVAVN